MPSGTTYEQLQYADYVGFLNELSESLGSFWINPTWWIPEAENPVISNAWELNTLKGFGELTEVKGSGIVYKIPKKGWNAEPEASKINERFADYNFDGASENGNSYNVPARGLGDNNPLFTQGTNLHCIPGRMDCDKIDWTWPYEATVNPNENASYTRQIKNSPVRLVRFGDSFH